MAGETVVTIIGNLVDDPELRFTPGGAAVAKFRVASVPRVMSKETQQWEDAKDGLFLTCSVWRQAAENAAESLSRGMRVIVQGRLKQRSYEDGQGVKRTVYELDVDEVGPSLKNATAKVTKASGGGQQRPEVQQAARQQGAVSAGDPWAQNTPGTSQSGGGGGWGQQAGQGGGGREAWGEEPPF